MNAEVIVAYGDSVQQQFSQLPIATLPAPVSIPRAVPADVGSSAPQA